MISPLLWYASLVTKCIQNNSFLISFLVLHTIRFTPVQKRILTPSARERERDMDLAMAIQELWTLDQMTNHMMSLAETRIQARLDVSLCKHFV
jgi:hypothetical protein